MKHLITGTAGFIGFHLAKRLLERGEEVVGFDNVNDYYSVELKRDRLAQLADYDRYTFVEADLADQAAVESVFRQHDLERVVGREVVGEHRHQDHEKDESQTGQGCPVGFEAAP